MTGIPPYTFDDSAVGHAARSSPRTCLQRQSPFTYKLIDPANPEAEDALFYDVGQLKQIFLMDKRLREEGAVRSIPAGYLEFATRFNAFATGPERFATFQLVKGKYVITTSGRPITWECLMTGDDLPVSSSMQEYHGEEGRDGLMPAFGFMDGSTNTQLHALSTYMRGVMNTTDELTRFWIKRSAIEQQYASRLADLAEKPIGKNELPEIRNAMDSLRMETAKQAMNRFELAKQIVSELEKPCVELQVKQRKHWRETYEPAARKLSQNGRPHEKRRRSATIGTEWKQEYKKLRYSLDQHRLESMKADFMPFNETPTPSDWSQSDLSTSSTPTMDSSDWETLRESCAQLEKDRAQRVKDMVSAFSQTLSSIRDTDDESAIITQRTTDLLNPSNLLEEFDQKFGSIERYVPPVATTVVRVRKDSNSRSSDSEMTPTALQNPTARALPTPPVSKRQTSGKRSQLPTSESRKMVTFQLDAASTAPNHTTKQTPRKSVALLPLAGSQNCRPLQHNGSSYKPPYSRPKLPKLSTNLSSTIFI